MLCTISTIPQSPSAATTATNAGAEMATNISNKKRNAKKSRCKSLREEAATSPSATLATIIHPATMMGPAVMRTKNRNTSEVHVENYETTKPILE